jgi:YggT family protein
MLYSLIAFLLDVFTGLVGGACLLRLYMQWQRVPFANPLGRFVMALSNWVVLPLRRMLPNVQRWDVSSLAAALLLELVQYGLLWLLSGGHAHAVHIVLLALLGLARLVISGLSGLLLVYAVLSWVQNSTPLVDLLDRLCAPLLRPVRRLVPLVGGVDLSVLVVLVLLQVAAMLLGHLQWQAMQL